MTLANCPICHSQMGEMFTLNNGKSVYKCTQCGLRGLRPLPDGWQLREFYNRDEYYNDEMSDLHNDLTVGYKEDSPIIKLYNRHLDYLKPLLPPPAMLLEVGCARGVFLDLARKRGYQVAGTEMNEHAYNYAKEFFFLEVIKSPIEEAPFAPGSFDGIISLDVIEHLIDPRTLMERASLLLKTNGVLVIGTPNANSPINRVAEGLAVFPWEPFKYPAFRFYGRGVEHLHIFNPQNLTQLFKDFAFDLVGTYGYNIPLVNMCSVGYVSKCAIRVMTVFPYEFVVVGRKRAA